MLSSKTPGQKFRSKGFEPNHPLLIVPGGRSLPINAASLHVLRSVLWARSDSRVFLSCRSDSHRTLRLFPLPGLSLLRRLTSDVGLCSSCLKVVQTPYKEWEDRRIWLDITTIGFGKVWDVVGLSMCFHRGLVEPPLRLRTLTEATREKKMETR